MEPSSNRLFQQIDKRQIADSSKKGEGKENKGVAYKTEEQWAKLTRGEKFKQFFTHAKIQSGSEIIYVNRASLRKFLKSNPKERVGILPKTTIRSLLRKQVAADLRKMTAVPNKEELSLLLQRWGFNKHADAIIETLLQFGLGMQEVDDNMDKFLGRLQSGLDCLPPDFDTHSMKLIGDEQSCHEFRAVIDGEITKRSGKS